MLAHTPPGLVSRNPGYEGNRSVRTRENDRSTVPLRRPAQGNMRILNHDFAGHPFQMELSRALARRGHEVQHAYCDQLTTGTGALQIRGDDPDGLSIEPIRIGRDFDRYSVVRRPRDEVSYGRAVRRALETFGPDTILSGNTPVLAQAMIRRQAQRQRTRFVFWLHDALSVGATKELEGRAGRLGAAAAGPLRVIERRSLTGSDHVVAITEDFLPLLQEWAVPGERVTVIENWAPRGELAPTERANAWADEHGIADDVPNLLYSGTLGLKHDPEMLAALAETVSRHARVVVVSEGIGADYLAEQCQKRQLDNLVLLPFQPYDRLGEVLSSGDVLLALLEPDAGVFSVPSKILTYHCVGRSILAAMPGENLAASIIEREESGLVTLPGDRSAFADAALHMLSDAQGRIRMGSAARAYAERAFDIEAITDRFEKVLVG